MYKNFDQDAFSALSLKIHGEHKKNANVKRALKSEINSRDLIRIENINQIIYWKRREIERRANIDKLRKILNSHSKNVSAEHV